MWFMIYNCNSMEIMGWRLQALEAERWIRRSWEVQTGDDDALVQDNGLGPGDHRQGRQAARCVQETFSGRINGSCWCKPTHSSLMPLKRGSNFIRLVSWKEGIRGCLAKPLLSSSWPQEHVNSAPLSVILGEARPFEGLWGCYWLEQNTSENMWGER